MRDVSFWWFALPVSGMWVAMVGRVGWADAVMGLMVVSSAWLIFRRLADFEVGIPRARAGSWLWGIGRYLLGYVAPEVVRSTFRVFGKVIAPRLELRPAILAVRVPSGSPAVLILLAYGISLTPGQQLVDLDETEHVLYVHFLDAPDPEAARQRILDLYHRFLEGVIP